MGQRKSNNKNFKLKLYRKMIELYINDGNKDLNAWDLYNYIADHNFPKDISRLKFDNIRQVKWSITKIKKQDSIETPIKQDNNGGNNV